jgi:4'-phosphopantetheinyl transferase
LTHQPTHNAALRWVAPAGAHVLAANEVHVWRARVSQAEDCLPELMQILTPDERGRAARFRFAVDRQRCILGRGLIRIILGHHLRRPSHELAFAYNAFDKPRLADTRDSGLQFNISHSGEWLLIALAQGRILGVDVEHMREDMVTREIAERFFSATECGALASLPAEEQCDAFFACWTRKEAYLKARGDGLSLPLDQFDVAFVPGVDARLLATRHDPAEVNRWSLCALDVGPGHKAALVVEGTGWALKLLEWPGGLNFLAQPKSTVANGRWEFPDRAVKGPI